MNVVSETGLGQHPFGQRAVGRFSPKAVGAQFWHLLKQVWISFHADETPVTREDMMRVIAKSHNCTCGGTCPTCRHLVDDVWPS